jgi:hypothetical protein
VAAGTQLDDDGGDTLLPEAVVVVAAVAAFPLDVFLIPES